MRSSFNGKTPKTRLILDQVRAGFTSPAEISKRTGISQPYVRVVLARMRGAGYYIPEPWTGDKPANQPVALKLSRRTMAAVAAQAAKRGVTVEQMATKIFTTLIQDDLLDAVLDEED